MATRYYLGIAEPGPRNWSISFPAFPGTVTTGSDFDSLVAHARDALASVICALTEDSKALPDGFDGETPGYEQEHYCDPRVVLLLVEVSRNAV